MSELQTNQFTSSNKVKAVALAQLAIKLFDCFRQLRAIKPSTALRNESLSVTRADLVPVASISGSDI